MKITVLGAGAMGCLYGGMLAEAGHDVTFIDIRQEQVDALNRSGIEIETADQVRRIKNVRAVTAPDKADKTELLLVFVKAASTEQAMRSALVLMEKNTFVLTLQNGLGNIETLNTVAGKAPVLAGTTGHGATLLRPGRVRHAGTGETILGEQNGLDSARVNTLATLFNHAGIATKVSTNITGLIWTKLIVNVGINALTAISGLRNGQLLDYPESETLMRSAVEEAYRIARAKGIRLDVDDIAEHTRHIALKTAENHSSMLQDVLAKRKTEVSAINGAIVNEGKKLGIEVPVNTVLTKLLSLKEKTYTLTTD